MANFKLEIVTPDKKFFEGDVQSITFNSLMGRIQILANHIPYASGLLPSLLKIKQDSEEKYAAIAGGFVEFMDNKATIIADAAEWPEEIDVERAEKALERAEERLEKKGSDADIKKAEIALRRASVRLKAAEMKRSKQ